MEGFDDKHRLLVGRHLSVKSNVDLLKGLTKERIEELAVDMNERQRECFVHYLRQIPKNIALIHGPFGAGKTILVQKIAEAAAEQGKNVLITTSSNSTAGSAIAKLTTSRFMVVRVHPLGLERCSLLQTLFNRPKPDRS